MRLKISYSDKKGYYIKEQPKLWAKTKQELFRLVKSELELKKIHIRRDSIVCI